MKKYDLIVCGGTFDLLHKGHKSFLEQTLAITDKVIIGITSNSYVSKFKNEQIEDFEIRKGNVVDFLSSINAADRVKIVSINQAYEPLLTSEFSPRAIAVTTQTQKTANEINKKRKELGLPELEIIIIPMEKAEDGGLISSTRIRNGEINRDGKLYVRKDWLSKNLILPQSLRPFLHKPFGKVLDSVPKGLNGDKVIAIGDVTAKKLNEKKVGQFLSIVDFRVKRQKKFKRLSELGFADDIKTVMVENQHGTIAQELFESVKSALAGKERQVILVNGEEDLSFLPVMLLAPLGYTVYYGQPDEGLVEVLVTEENKEKVFELVNKFDY